MKRYTTRFLKSVALAYMAFPVLYIVVAAVLFDIPAHACMRILISPFYYIVSIPAVLAGYGLWEMRRWAWYAFCASGLFIAYENALLVNDYGTSHHRLLAYLASLGLLFMLSYRVAREIRVPYFFPKIRWWESNPRYRLSVPVELSLGTAQPLAAEILDLSMGGCFVKLRNEMMIDDVLKLEFKVFGIAVACEGTIVWRTSSTVTHPKGVGVKFGTIDRKDKRSLRLITRRLRKIASLYRRSRYLLNQDEFMKRLEQLEAPRIPHDQVS